MLRDSVLGLWQVLRSMGLTLRFFFSRPVTVQYPDEPVQLYPRFRGRHQLLRYEDGPYEGLERCIGCALCAAYCPTQCIYVQAGENKDGVRRSPGERYAEIYEINLLRCMFCGYCEEACPTGAIVMRREFALADYQREKLLYTQDRLLELPTPDHRDGAAEPRAVLRDDQQVPATGSRE
ncbi:MAG: NADH-quinone oxidoreductase subunit NuoI [Anaerolineaceae bacterium]|nr:NADH-quinone oxidoreductase subunit NuoI [Anaerolineaceae bacterium]